MPLFVLACHDKDGGLPVRMAARPDHLAWVQSRIDVLKLGGPMLDEAGQMAGSLFILDLPDRAAVEAFHAEDPYTKAGVWGRVDIRAFRASFGKL